MPSLIRLCPRPFSSLPAHPAFDSNHHHQQHPAAANPDNTTEPTAPPPSRPDLHTFLHTVLTEAQNFLITTIPRTFKIEGKPRTSPPATAKVQLLNRLIRADEQELDHAGSREDEYWVCRRSLHLDAPVDGTASWEEFRAGLRENHSENELEYTPSLSGVERLVEWPLQEEIEGGWREVDMHVTMLTHTFQPQALIAPRTFISLIISALLPPASPTINPGGWVTIQLPLAYEPADSVPEAIKARIVSSAPKNTIFASYASIERLVSLSPSRRTSSASATTNNNNSIAATQSISRTLSQSRAKVEWTLATTSDPGGSVPQWVAQSWFMGGVPKAVVRDVGLFIGWIAEKRRAATEDTTNTEENDGASSRGD